MDAKRTVSILINPRTGDLAPVVREFRSMFSQIRAEAEKFSKESSNSFKNFGGAVQTKTIRASFDDKELRKAQADIKRYQQENLRAEKAVAAEIARTDVFTANNKIREAKRAANGVISSLSQIQKQSESSAKQSSGVFTSSLGGSFFGTLGANAVGFFLGQIAQLPGKVSQIVGEAVKLSEGKINALKGLDSIAAFKGIDPKAAQDAVSNFRLVKAGVVDVSDATTALKNLLATGFSLPEANRLFEAFSDSAAFGKQSALGFGEAIRGATEGLKNGNSILVDNAGITKNLSVILEEQGKSQKDVMNITSDASVRQAVFNGLLKEAQGNIGDADKLTQGYTGSVSGLEQAYINLYRAGGDLITQSPEIVAANLVQAEQVRDLTDSLFKQSSQTKQNADDWLLMYARIKAATLPFAAALKNQFMAIFAALSGFGAGVLGAIAGTIELAIGGIKNTINTAVNFLIDGYNAALNLAKKLPVLPVGVDNGFTLAIQGAQPIQERYNNTDIDLSLSKRLFEGMQTALAASDEYQKGVRQSLRELDAAQGDLDTFRRALKEDREAEERQRPFRGKTVVNDANGIPIKLVDGVPTSSGSTTSTGGKTKKGAKLSTAGIEAFATDRTMAQYQQSLRKLSPGLRAQILDYAEKYGIPGSLALAQIFSESSFNAGAVSPFNKNVGQSAFGLTQVLPSTATSVLKRKTSGKDLLNTDTALTAYGEYMTKLFTEFGDWELAVFAYHNGEGEARKLVRLLDEGNQKKIAGFTKSRPKGISYIKKISALSGLSKDEQFGVVDPAKESDALTKAARTAESRRLFEVYKRFGLTPTDLLNDFTNLLADDAKKGLDVGFGIGIQPTKEQVAKLFQDGRSSLFGNSPQTSNLSDTPGTIISNRLNADEQYISDLRESLGIEDKITSLVFQRRNLTAEISVLYENSIYQQGLDLLDVEKQIGILQKQNADDAFVANRRALEAKSEELSLQQEITGLNDKLANNGINDGLEIQAAYLRDVLSLRRQELEAVISINRSQLELSQKGVFSQTQSDAKVFDFLNQNIKSVSETFADFRIGIAETFFDAVTSPFDALSKKLESLNPIVRGLAETFLNLGRDIVKAFSQKIIMRLLGLDEGSGGIGDGTNPGNAGGGFSLGGIINKIKSFFGGGGSANRSAGGSSGYTQADGGISTTARAILSGGSGSGISGGSSGFSSIFGSQGFGNNVGTYGALGAGAGILGSLIGGRVGGFISGAGSGLGIGASIGSMIAPGIGTAIGAGIGALAGGLLSLFGGDPKRKQDKKENLPKLNQGFVQAFAQLQQVLSDSDALKFNPPEEANTKAAEIYAQIKNGFGVEFLSNKYKKESQTIIAQKTKEADAIVSQIKNSVLNAQSYGRDAAALVPVFASGAFISRYGDFKRRNGMLGGVWTGRDTLPSMLAEGEMVLNPSQQNRVRSSAGFDVFKGAGIPNYADGGFIGANSSSGASSPAIVIEPKFSLVINGVTMTDQFEAYLESEDGTKKVVEVSRKGNSLRVGK